VGEGGGRQPDCRCRHHFRSVATVYQQSRQNWGTRLYTKVIFRAIDLRRTRARLCHQAGGELDQIQFLLGHVSIQTTEPISGASSVFTMRLMITSAWSRMRRREEPA
jgi:integrase